MNVLFVSEYRQWSNRVSLAYKMIIITPIFWFLLTGHRIIFYRIEDGVCGPPDGFYEYYDNYFQVIFSSLAPAVVMSILAYLLIKSVRGVIKRRVAPVATIPSTITPKSSMINQMDTQLTIMLILESFITIITYVPYATQLIYSNVTQYTTKSPLRLAWENALIELIHLFSYIFFGTSFYVSIISNVGFRRKLKQFFGMKIPNQSEDFTVNIIRTQPAVTHQTSRK
jgi:hypothetical protein